MKSILALITMLFATHANAVPVVGDFVRYQTTESTPSSSQVTELKIEVLSIDAATETYKTQVTYTQNGKVLSRSISTSDLNSTAADEATFDHCAELPADMAAIETITVPAGSFQVCHIISDLSGSKMHQYLGKVLFGLVKSSVFSPYGSQTIELIELNKH